MNTKESLEDLKNYLKKVRELTGQKIKMNNPITRADYEFKSVRAKHWLTLEEYEKSLSL